MDEKENGPRSGQAIGPWQCVNSAIAYENPWIRVYHEEVITPGKTEGIYGRVHFKGTAIGIIPIDNEGNTYLVGQYRYTLDEYSWEIPMGGAKAGEDRLIAAQRELEEETGLKANKWQEIQRLHTSNSITDEQGFVYLAMDLQPGKQNLEPSEDIIVKKMRLDEAVSWAMDGKITDAISVAGLLKASILLK